MGDHYNYDIWVACRGGKFDAIASTRGVKRYIHDFVLLPPRSYSCIIDIPLSNFPLLGEFMVWSLLDSPGSLTAYQARTS